VQFETPQTPIEIAPFRSTPIASEYHQVHVRGDATMFKGRMKALFAAGRMTTGAAGIGSPQKSRLPNLGTPLFIPGGSITDKSRSNGAPIQVANVV